MADEGPNSPTANSETADGGSQTWRDETNTYAEDGAFATASVGADI